MSESTPRPRKSRKAPAVLAGTRPASTDGSWELDPLTGIASFSDWFYERLQWPTQVKRRRLCDLRSYLPDGAWETLLLQIRDHLERQLPLDAQLCVRLGGGQIEWWRMQGSAERDVRGKPVYLRGSVRDVSANRHPDSSEDEA
jgi:PAS domain-containing protein